MTDDLTARVEQWLSRHPIGQFVTESQVLVRDLLAEVARLQEIVRP